MSNEDQWKEFSPEEYEAFRQSGDEWASEKILGDMGSQSGEPLHGLGEDTTVLNSSAIKDIRVYGSAARGESV